MTVLLQLGRRPPEPTPTAVPGGLAAEVRVFHDDQGPHLFVADGSRVYDLPEGIATRLERWLSTPSSPAEDIRFAAVLGLPLWQSAPRIDGTPARPGPLSSISLNVMQACNLS